MLTVVPGVMGICTWSPRLDAQGNSVRGIESCRKLVEHFNFHVYDGLGGSTRRKADPRRPAGSDDRQLLVDLCWAASEGDCDGIQRLVVRGADVNAADYDGRTPLHLAASEGRLEAVRALLRLGASAVSRDRWGNTPGDDALREDRPEVGELLAAAG